MENFLQLIYEFFGNNSELLFLLTVVFDIVFGVLLFVRTKNKKIMEDLAMKYRTEQTRNSSEFPSAKVEFSPFRDEFRLNKSTGEIEKTGVVDIDELVNSFDAQTLKAIYERFFPQTPQDDAIIEYTHTQDDLDLMQEAFAKAEEYRARYKIGEDVHFSEVFRIVNSKNKELKDKIDFVEKFKAEANKNGESVSQKIEDVAPNGQSKV